MSNVIRLRTPTERDRKAAFRAELGVSVRVVNLLWGRGIRSVEELTAMSWADIRVIRGMGWTLETELEDALAQLRLELDRLGRYVEPRTATEADKAESIAVLDLAPATVTALAASGVNTVGDLVSMYQAQLARLPRVGSTMLLEIGYALSGRGLSLSQFVRFPRPKPPIPGDTDATIDALAEYGPLGTRAYFRLTWAGATTAGKIAAMSAEELLALPGFGRGTLAQVRGAMDFMGMALRGEQVSKPRKRR